MRHGLAVTIYILAVGLIATGATVDPKDRFTRGNVAEAFQGLGRSLAGEKQFKEAAEAFTQAEEIRRKLIEEFPKLSWVHDDLSEMLSELADLHFQKRDLQASRETLLNAIEVQQKAMQIARVNVS